MEWVGTFYLSIYGDPRGYRCCTFSTEPPAFHSADAGPANHLLEVELQIQEVDPEVPLRLRLPVWTPGSYLVREYARHVQEFQAATEQGIPLAWRKVD